jgi:hypothetical protein
MARQPTKQPQISDSPSSNCPYCVKTEETNTRDGAWKRQAHYLRLAASEGVDALQKHLDGYLSRWYGDNYDEAKAAIDRVMAWVWDEVRTYSGMVGEDGAPVPWHVARQQTRDAMQATYAALEQQGRQAEQARGRWPLPSEPWTSISWEVLQERRRQHAERSAATVGASDPLDYAPTTDPEDAKRRARAQYGQLADDGWPIEGSG